MFLHNSILFLYFLLQKTVQNYYINIIPLKQFEVHNHEPTQELDKYSYIINYNI